MWEEVLLPGVPRMSCYLSFTAAVSPGASQAWPVLGRPKHDSPGASGYSWTLRSITAHMPMLCPAKAMLSSHLPSMNRQQCVHHAHPSHMVMCMAMHNIQNALLRQHMTLTAWFNRRQQVCEDEHHGMAKLHD